LGGKFSLKRKAIQKTDLSVNMKGELKDHINLIKDSLSVRKSGSLKEA